MDEAAIGPSRANVRRLALREWTWRYGEAAASHRMALDTWIIRAAITSTLGFGLVIVGGVTHQPIVLGLGAVALAIWITLDICIWVELHRMNRAISAALGIPIDLRSHPGPPRGADKYRAWCQRNHIQEYPFKPPNTP